MGRKVKKNEWKCIQSRPIPHSVTIIPSSGPGTYTYAHAKRGIVETRVVMENGKEITEWREREDFTPAVYMSERPDLRTHFSVALAVLPEIEEACFGLGGKKKKKK